MPPSTKDLLSTLRKDFVPFCRKHGIRSLAVFGSVSRGAARSDSDLDLLADPAEGTTTGQLLEMAGEAEEIAGRPVDFVLLPSLEKAADRARADLILSSSVRLYGR